MRSWLLYTVLRIGLFAVVFALLYWLIGEQYWWLAAICAALIALCISYIFLAGLRERVTVDLATRARARAAAKTDPDAAAEDVD